VDDDADWNDGSEFPGVCCWCSKPRLVENLPDPFIEELHPEMDNPPEMWCRACYGNRKDEV
jgi:hypothetical protein